MFLVQGANLLTSQREAKSALPVGGGNTLPLWGSGDERNLETKLNRENLSDEGST